MDKNKSNFSLEARYGYVPCKTIMHANEGEFTTTLKHKSGGHGQDSIVFMNDNNIKYEILKVHSNGVREGNIIKSKQTFARKDGNHTWFPESWTKQDIRTAGEYVDSLTEIHTDGVVYEGIYKEVKVCIIYTNNEVGSIFPKKGQ